MQGGLLLFESKSTADYHKDMNAALFEEYFEQMITLLPPNSVIVMNNASYHTRKTERLPSTCWRKNEIIQWLLDKNIDFEDGMLKKELLCVANLHKERFTRYVVD